jgi:hypothetical protein
MSQPNDHKHEPPGQNKEVDIIVNAREKKWFEKKITFEQVVVLAFGLFENNESTSYTITYKRGEDKKPEGSMVVGDTIPVKDKMIFNVSKTNKS